jgi:hypothetical protein
MTEIVKKVKSIRWQYLMIIVMVAMVAAGTESCKSTGGMSRKEKKAQIEMYKKQLQEVINGTSKLSFDEQQRLISDVVNKNFNDPDLNALIIQAQQKIKAAYAEVVKSQEQKIAAARTTLYDLLANKDNLTADQLQAELNKVKAQKIMDGEIDDLVGRVQDKIDKMKLSGTPGPLKTQIESAFDGLVSTAKAGDVSTANTMIQGIISKYFTSENTPVLIIISKEGSIIDYDKPTTIKLYLNFIKDQKASRNNVDSYLQDESGKIKELDLIKK